MAEAELIQNQRFGSIFWVSCMGAVTQVLKPFFDAFQGYKQGAALKLEQLGHNPVSIWDS